MPAIIIKNPTLPLPSTCLTQLATIHKNAFTRAWDGDALKATLADPHSFIWLGFYEGCLAGFLLARFVSDEGEILTLAVAPDFRRVGVARHLLIALRDEAQKSCIKRLFLDVAADNAPAIALYKAPEWVAYGHRPAYYGAVDAILLQSKLG